MSGFLEGAPRLPSSVAIREVGPRDGLQGEAPVSPVRRAKLVAALARAGAREIEVAAFVSPRAVPAMAGAAEVMALSAGIEGLRRVALVPNARGAADAVAADADALTSTISASPAYNERNVGMSIAESLQELKGIVAAKEEVGIELDVVISCSFGSPYEGDIDPQAIGSLADACRATGADRITLADTTGMATPRRIDAAIDLVGPDVGLHLHETRGTGLVNAYAGLLRGVTRFDTSIGGLGGSPFADGAAGNLATEGLVAVLADLDVESGFDLSGLREALEVVRGLVYRDLPSPVAATLIS